MTMSFTQMMSADELRRFNRLRPHRDSGRDDQALAIAVDRMIDAATDEEGEFDRQHHKLVEIYEKHC